MAGHDFGYRASEYAAFAGRLNDPGNGGIIAIEPNGSHKTLAIKTAGAETRTLRDPSQVGLHLTVFMDTDGGNCVITADTAVNEAGNNTITLDDPGETIKLESITIGGVAVWRVVGTDGAALSTV